MEVTYRMTGDELKRDYLHLYYRLKQLDDYLVCFYVRGNLKGLVSSEYDRTGIPYIEEATFDDAAAQAYQEKLTRFFALPTRKQGAVPFPDFSVRLKINFCDGNVSMHTFDFAKISEETATAFCKSVRDDAFCFWKNQYPNGMF